MNFYYILSSCKTIQRKHKCFFVLFWIFLGGILLSCKEQNPKPHVYNKDNIHREWLPAVLIDSSNQKYTALDGYRKPGEKYGNRLSMGSRRIFGYLDFRTIRDTIVHIDSLYIPKTEDYMYSYHLGNGDVIRMQTFQKKDGEAYVQIWTQLRDNHLGSLDTIFSVKMIPYSAKEYPEFRDVNDIPKELFDFFLYPLDTIKNRYVLPCTNLGQEDHLTYNSGKYYKISDKHWVVWRKGDIQRLYDYQLDENNDRILYVRDSDGHRKSYYLSKQIAEYQLKDILDKKQLPVEVLSPVYTMSFEKASLKYIQGESIGNTTVINDTDEYVKYKYPQEYAQKPLYSIDDFGRPNGGLKMPINYRIYKTNYSKKGGFQDHSSNDYLLIMCGVFEGELYVMGEQIFSMNRTATLSDFHVQGERDYYESPIFYSSDNKTRNTNEYKEREKKTKGGFRLTFTSENNQKVTLIYDLAFDWDYVQHTIREATSKYFYTWLLTNVVNNDLNMRQDEFIDLRFSTVTYPFRYWKQ